MSARAILEILLCGIALAVSDAATAQQYDITIDLGPAPHAHVEARLVVGDGRLFMHSHAGGYEWSDYIHDLKVRASDGSPVDAAMTGKSEWRIANASRDPVRLTYDVDLGFTIPVREGAQRGGQWFEGCMYLVNRVLFVMSNAAGKRTVSFHLPRGAKVASPLTRTGPFTFEAVSNDDLVDNTTIVGTFPVFAIDEGRSHVDLALPGATDSEGSLVRPVVRKVMHEYLRMFPDTPEYRILLTFFHGFEVNGEAYRASASLTFPEPINIDYRDLWANYIAHELFHHWNPYLVSSDSPQESADSTEWFSEGGTEYISNRTLARTKIIDRAAWMRHLETNIAMYKFWTWATPYAGISLQDASVRTALTMPKDADAKSYNRAGVYNGGWVAAFCVDAKLSVSTGARKDIDDLFRLLRSRFGSKGHSWTNTEFVSAASEIAGRDLSSDLVPYLESPSSIPVNACLADAGLVGYNLNYSGETKVWPSPHAGTTTRRTLERILIGTGE